MINIGDIVTIEGVRRTRKNPKRKWYTPWRARMIVTDETHKFVVSGVVNAPEKA